MYVTVQLPVVDVRSLLAQVTHRDPLPYFPSPDRVYSSASADHHRSNYVRGLGAVRPRLQGGAPPWLSESYYIDLHRQLRVARQRVEPRANDGNYVEGTPVYRNFYTDGVVGRVEVCFRLVGRRGAAPLRPEVAHRVVVGAPTRLRDGVDGAGPLIGAGPAFARHLLRATTRGGQDPPSWWVRAAPPAVISELLRDQQSLGHRLGDPVLVHRWITAAGVRASAWQLSQGVGYADEMRRLRVHLSRLHADFVAAQTLLGLCQSGQLDARYPPAERYLTRTLDLLLRPARHGFAQNELLALALRHSGEAHADTMAALRFLAREVANPALTERADRLGESLERAADDEDSDAPRIVVNVRELVMTKYEPHIEGGTFTGAVNFGSGGAHAQIGPAPDQLRPLVQQLFDTFLQLHYDLPEEQRRKGFRAAEDIEEEANREPGQRSKIRLLARLESILSVAGSAGAAGMALGQAATAIRAAFGL